MSEPRIISSYIYAEVVEEKPKTTVWAIRNKKSTDWLATVAWYGPWRQYCLFTVNHNAIFNQDCLESILAFLKAVRMQRKRENE